MREAVVEDAGDVVDKDRKEGEAAKEITALTGRGMLSSRSAFREFGASGRNNRQGARRERGISRVYELGTEALRAFGGPWEAGASSLPAHLQGLAVNVSRETSAYWLIKCCGMGGSRPCAQDFPLEQTNGKLHAAIRQNAPTRPGHVQSTLRPPMLVGDS